MGSDRYTFSIISRLPQGPWKGLLREPRRVAVPRAGQRTPRLDGVSVCVCVCIHARAGGMLCVCQDPAEALFVCLSSLLLMLL